MNSEVDDGNRGSTAFLTAKTDWDIRIIAVPSAKGFEPLLVSYGEMNTLADIYGSTEELKAADPVDRWNIIQGIRQQSLFRFMDMKNKVEGKSPNKPYLGDGFTGAYGNTGRADNVGPLPLGEIGLVMSGKKGAAPVDSYTSALARNACHFAPESWYAWANYHKRGIDFARQGFNLKQQAAIAPLPSDKKKLTAQADEAYNNAMLENGFGDHYLQDSYAAGHLINKTGIMQEFIKWMDKNPGKWDFMQEKNWRQMQDLAYNQEGLGHEAADDHYNVSNVGKDNFAPKDPQSVENIKGGDWVKRFKTTGMVLPNSLQPGTHAWGVLVYLQEASLGLLGSNKTSFKDLTKAFGADLADGALSQLLGDGIVYVDGQSQKDRGEMLQNRTIKNKVFETATFILDNVYRPTDKNKFRQVVNDYNNKDPVKKAAAKESYEEMGMQVQYNAYHMMLKNTAIQLATNVMHNKFCKEGLEVQTGNNDKLGRIYGDDNMNKKDSQLGVQYSATTAHMSRDSVINTYENGAEGVGKSTEDIAKRFPNRIKVGNGYKRIDAWHGTKEFQDIMDEEFGAAGTRAKVGAMVTKDAVAKGAKNVLTLGLINLAGPSADVGDVTAVVSKDEVHSGEAF